MDLNAPYVRRDELCLTGEFGWDSMMLKFGDGVPGKFSGTGRVSKRNLKTLKAYIKQHIDK